MKSIFTNFNLRPINKTAGLVTSAGFEFKPIKELENCLKDIPAIIDSSIGYCGITLGRFSVIGLHAVGKRGGKWVCRCACGNYVICTGKRISDAIKNSHLSERCMCNECDYLIYIRKNRQPTTPISKTNRSLKKQKRGLNNV